MLGAGGTMERADGLGSLCDGMGWMRQLTEWVYGVCVKSNILYGLVETFRNYVK